jgi:glycosyltransferase involved in cell wall biosynthesis
VSRRLTILHVDTERGWRGGERQALWLARGVARAGHRSLVAARADEPLAGRAATSGLEVIPCAPAGELDLRAALALRRTIRRERVDIVHAHTAHAVALAALATLATSARMVLTRRVDFPLRANPFTRWKYGRADAIIAISHVVQRILVESGIPAARITVVPSGVDLSRTIAPAPREVLAGLGVPAGVPLVVMVAALVPHKDPLTFVRAVAALRGRGCGAHALLVGDGGLRGAVEQEVDRLALGDVLHVTGYRPDADALLAAANVVVLSSVEEGLGTVLIDAMALGKPVVATSAGGIPELVVPEETGVLVPPRDPDALGAAIAAILADPPRAARLGAGARARAPLFSVEHTVSRTIAIYERVMAGNAGR